VASHVERFIKSKRAEGSPIDIIVTFDNRGISGHPNHIAVHGGVMEASRNLAVFGITQILTLESVSLFRKYLSYADSIFCSTMTHLIYFAPSPLDSHRALTHHDSQYVWFRKLFVLFSRYTFINTLTSYKLRADAGPVEGDE
jgi:N-acetylglucosaminylphosphatidylinositol deacetylase